MAAPHDQHRRSAWIDDVATAASTTSAPRSRAIPTSPTTRSPSDVRENVLVYYRRTRWPRPTGAPCRPNSSARCAEGPGVVVFEGAFARDVVDRASAAFTAIIEAQRADGCRRRRPLRQARRQRPDLERRAEARAARPRGVRRLLRQRRARPGVAGLAGPALPGHLPGQRRQSRWRSTGPAPRLPPRLRRRRPVGRLSGARAPDVAGTDAAGRGRALRHAARQRADDAAAATRSASSAAMSRSTGPSSSTYFAEHHVQLPLRKGDAVFFNPALYHGAGANISTDIRRMANLLQISSPFGRAMEVTRPHRDGARRLPGAARHAGRGTAATRPAPTPWSPPPRATRSPPTSTATSRSAAWRPSARSTRC